MHYNLNGIAHSAVRAAFAALLVSALAACGGKAAPQAPPPVEVNALELQPGAMALSLEHAAQLRGVREVEVRPRVSGILLKRLYREGARVKQGDLLFQIDPAPFRADAEKLRAELGVQQANLVQAQRERDRILPLYEQKLVSLRDRDTAIAGYETAAAAVEAARAALQRAELDVSYTSVRAPIGGLTSREVQSEGSLVAAESTLLTHVVQTDRLYVEFSVPQSEAESLRRAVTGDAAEVVGVRVTDIQGNTLGQKAKIEFIAPSVGDQTGTVDVRAVLENTDGKLLPGQVVRAHVEGVSLAGTLVIPKRAVMHGMQGEFVWTIDSANQVAPRPVKLGATSGNNVAVVSGLAGGDRVVVDGILKVQPGALVRATPVNLDGTPLAPAEVAQKAP